jgi:hypothetical protein
MVSGLGKGGHAKRTKRPNVKGLRDDSFGLGAATKIRIFAA